MLARPSHPAVRFGALAVLAVGLVLTWISHITASHLEIDATESVRMGVSLVHHGVMSLDECDEGCFARGIYVRPKLGAYSPSNYREPLPVLVSALGVWIIDSFMGPASPESYLEGPRAQYLKYQNLFWLGLLSVSVWVAIETLAGSFWLALLGVALVNYQLLPGEFTIDNLDTELAGMALLVPASICLTLAFTRGKVSLFLLAGLLFGILTLVKAIVLYVFVGVVMVLIGLFLLQRRYVRWSSAAGAIAVMVVAFGCVLAPWLYRNYSELGTLQITQRGGESLYERSLEDRISPDEYAGAFYLWVPSSSLHDWLGRKLHFSPADLLRGGRLQRLDTDFSSALSRADRDGAVVHGQPEQAVTLFRQAQAELLKLHVQLEAAGRAHPDVDAERTLYKLAEASIIAHPWSHLKLTAAFMVRGAAKAFPVLTIALLLGFLFKRYDLLLFVLPAFGMTLLYAAFTPFFYRYGNLPHLIATISLLVMLKWGWDAIRAHRVVSPRPLA